VQRVEGEQALAHQRVRRRDVRARGEVAHASERARAACSDNAHAQASGSSASCSNARRDGHWPGLHHKGQGVVHLPACVVLGTCCQPCHFPLC
jgi:hypothetical protein